MDGAKDFQVKITVKNGRLARAIRDAGFKTVTACAKVSGVEVSVICSLLLFKKSPVYKNEKYGEWTEYAWRLSSALHREPEELWPEHIARLKSRKNSIELSMDADEVRALSAPSDRQIDTKEYEQLVSKLPEKERHLLESLAICGGDKTLEEAKVGAGVNGGTVNRERVRQKANKSIRILKVYAARSGKKTLAEYMDEKF